MRNLSKIGLAIILILTSIPAVAQVKFGIKTGLNVNSVSIKLEDGEADEFFNKSYCAYHFGAVVQVGLSDALSLQSGLIYSSKGFEMDLEEELKEYDMDGLTVEGYDRYIFNYLELPFNFTYRISDIQIYAGPYMAVMVGGKNKYDYTYEMGDNSESDKDEYKFKPVFSEVKDGDIPDDQEALYGLDYGLNIGAGYTFGAFQVHVGFSKSFGNVIPAYEGDEGSRNDNKLSPNAITVSASYYFGL